MPGELDVGVVCVRTRDPKVDLAHVLGGSFQNHLGESDARLGAMTKVGVVIGQFLGLFADRINHGLASVADVDTVQPRKAIQQLITVAVIDINPFATGHHDLGSFLAHKLTEMGVRVKKTLPIPAFELSLFKHGFLCVLFVFRGTVLRRRCSYPLGQSKKCLSADLLIQQG